MLIYFEAERFMKPSLEGSLISRIFEDAGSKKIRSNPKQVYALVISTLKYTDYLKEIIKKSGILKQGGNSKSKIPKKLTKDLLILLVHDLLFTKQGRIQSAKHPIKDFVLANKTRLNSEFIKLKLKYKVKSITEFPVNQDQENNSDYNEDSTPVRWFRINTIKVKAESVLKKDPFFKNLKQVHTIEDLFNCLGNIYHDEYIPNLFGINPREKITNTNVYKSGKIILQDRSSCFPAYILNPKADEDVIIDACAAPGNKTSHLAMLIDNKTNGIIAFEKNEKRGEILKKMINKAGAKDCVNVKIGDFTRCKKNDYQNVTKMIIDPSCSGSGIFRRAVDDMILQKNNIEEELSLKKKIDIGRIEKLSSFQFSIVKFGLLFPNVKKVVYSTCSIHPEENEQVVIDLLNDFEIKSKNWRLCSKDEVIPQWKRRGWKKEFIKKGYSIQDSEDLAAGCVRSLPKLDGGIGFFAASFIRE
ncbi:rRNA (cytosine-C5-)-methyltransferase RCM1 [Ascoidea rubescens DSM 1968]|uniref:S-adenosyl-L-methionine-dependent methyltransferase n=1 Tax=Ascoidea rubescens DSM 1968 TaxID=1344418 RepID=A0A1D2VG16_9ASCO|nr:S-adenosyl-L-methionine-dependent methyltransferase [Ascoidea rubescens DSM 1968]ODV60624.1 S-adenosyl-L-methionine-dependent methyltransferase [Ascoidea rubescens DSM 1968]